MGLSTDWPQSPAADYPNRLVGGHPPDALPRRSGTLVLLVLLCLALRVLDALRSDFPWSDSVLYLRVSQALERGDYNVAFEQLGLNFYPVILMVLGRMGLDPHVAGSWWSVATASLTVLPLFGWVRRQFDDRVALVACALYAVHPKLLAFSHLIIRDPTYWFLFSFSLYLTWRAVTELRWWLFPASGIALTLTVYTRYEGWLLLVPLLLWAFWRLPAAAGSRARLILGTATCVAVVPILVIVVNVTWLRDHPRWEMGRLGELKAVWSWVVSSTDRLLAKPAAGSSIPAAAAEDGRRPTLKRGCPAACNDPAPCDSAPTAAISGDLSTFVLGRKVLLRFLKVLTYGYGFLMAVGLCRWRHVFFRRDQQALFLHNAILFVCIGVYYARHKGIDFRYFLPMVLIWLPYLALGLLQMAEWIVAPARHPSAKLPQRRAAAVAGLLAAVALIGIPDATLAARRVMLQQAELGRWILEHKGPNQTILGPSSALNLVEYHSMGRTISFPRNTHGDSALLVRVVRDRRPNVVLLWDDIYNREVWALRTEIASECSRLGYEQVPRDQLPPSCQDVQIFVAWNAPGPAQPSVARPGLADQRSGAGPIAGHQMAGCQKTQAGGVGMDPDAAPGVPQRGGRPAGVQGLQAAAAVATPGCGRAAQQGKIALAAAAAFGPRLPRPAGRTRHAVFGDGFQRDRGHSTLAMSLLCLVIVKPRPVVAVLPQASCM